eukprot:gene17684-biopygen3407
MTPDGRLHWLKEYSCTAFATRAINPAAANGNQWFQQGARGGRFDVQKRTRAYLQPHLYLFLPLKIGTVRPTSHQAECEAAKVEVRAEGDGQGRRGHRGGLRTVPFSDGRNRREEEVEAPVAGAELNNNLPYGGSSKQQPPIALGPLHLPPPQNRNRPRAHLLTSGGGGDGGEGRGRRSGRCAFPISDGSK